MNEYIIFLLCMIVSSLILSVIFFQFIEERNKRIYKNRFFYFALKTGFCLLLIIINLLNQPILNFISLSIMLSAANAIFYVNTDKNRILRILEIPVLILILSICEAIGGLFLQFILLKLHIDNIHLILLDGLETAFSKLFVIIFYYLVISKLWRSNLIIVKFTKTQYFIELIIILFSIANLAVIFLVVSKGTSGSERILLLINMGCILFADLYFLYFARFIEENSQLKMKLRLSEQQALFQYEYYAEQEKKYNESVKIFHDVNKHLKMIENIYQSKEDEIAATYAREIGQILIPLALEEYSNNPILNVLLNDKKRTADYHNIKFDIEAAGINLDFMEAAEITTIFGNLLDNAIEACDRVQKNKHISIKMEKFNDFIAINISNATLPIEKWSYGKPLSTKGKKHGIGLLNVENTIRKYNGSLVLKEEKNVFSCEIILNH